MNAHVPITPAKELIQSGVIPDPSDRMTVARKASILQAIASGAIHSADALILYAMSEEELGSWAERYRHHGHKGLKATVRHRPASTAD